MPISLGLVKWEFVLQGEFSLVWRVTITAIPAEFATMSKPDWRSKLASKHDALIDRLLVLSADEDSKIAFDSIKLLLELAGDLTHDPATRPPAAPLFALPTGTAVTLKGTA